MAPICTNGSRNGHQLSVNFFRRTRKILDKMIRAALDPTSPRSRRPGSYTRLRKGPIHTFSRRATTVKGRHTVKEKPACFELSTRGGGDFDQFNSRPSSQGARTTRIGPLRVLETARAERASASRTCPGNLATSWRLRTARPFNAGRALATDISYGLVEAAAPYDHRAACDWAIWPAVGIRRRTTSRTRPRFYESRTAANRRSLAHRGIRAQSLRPPS